MKVVTEVAQQRLVLGRRMLDAVHDEGIFAHASLLECDREDAMGIMDDRTRALRGTHAAGDAALLHDLGVAVNHMDCIGRTYPLAHAAGDAARAAGLAGGRAPVRTRTERLDRIV